jgi:hypothetical protein
MPAAIITPMLMGAAVGAVTAAISGGNILKGALMGAVTGGIGAAFSGVAAAVTGTAMSAATAPDAAGFAQSAPEPTGLSVTDSQGALESGAPPPAYETQSPASTGGMVGTGLSAKTAGTGMADPAAGGNTGLGTQVGNTGIGTTDPATGLSMAQRGMVTAPSGAGGVLDSLFNKGKELLGNRGFVDAAGKVLQGAAAGAAQERALEERRAAEERARQNARFGNVGSRYNPGGGMVTATPYK